MRTAFIQTLIELARKDKRIFLAVGDVGYSVVEPFIEEFPDRFINVGVAEQNMMGVASGLALSGNIVFTYTFANFSVLRCLEQIRNDICFHNANVKILGIGGGYAYGYQGMTHHGTESVAVLSALPNMVVMSPSDPVETKLAVKAAVEWDGPCYLQLRKAGEKVIHTNIPSFQIGKALMLRDGNDFTLIGTGWILHNTLKAAEMLSSEGYSVRVLSMPTIKPLDSKSVLASAKKTMAIVTIEENSTPCLGSAVAKVLATENNEYTPLLTLSLGDDFSRIAGSQDYLLHKAGLSADRIYASVKVFLEKHKKR